MLLDVDDFKAINDRHGHPVGDRVLQALAASLAGMLRPGDEVARVGGEEFLLVLVDADAEEARRVAGRLGDQTRALTVDPRHPDYHLSVSVGIAEFRPGESIEDVIQRADRALYRAKTSGRDLVIVG